MDKKKDILEFIKSLSPEETKQFLYSALQVLKEDVKNGNDFAIDLLKTGIRDYVHDHHISYSDLNQNDKELVELLINAINKKNDLSLYR